MAARLEDLFHVSKIPGTSNWQYHFYAGPSKITEAAAVILQCCHDQSLPSPENLAADLERLPYVVFTTNRVTLRASSAKKRGRTRGFELSQSQKKAVNHKEGPMMVRAGPGSGKTRVLTERVKKLATTGVKPSQILVISFTKAAADEVRDRLKRGGVGGDVARTFHSLGKLILQEYGKGFPGVPEDFKVCAAGDFKKIVEEQFKICKARSGLEHERFEDVLRAVAKARSEGGESVERLGAFERNVYDGYRDEMQKRKKLDFADLLLLTRDLLREREDVRMKCQERWSYLLIDEFQDTNALQLEIARFLAERGNIFVVGDPDQAIFGFQGAVPDVFGKFSESFPCESVFLEENYRCSGPILSSAQGLLEEEGPKQRAVSEEGEPVEVLGFSDSVAEATGVMDRIKQHLEEGVKGSEIAILFRTNAQAKAFTHAAKEACIAFVSKEVIGDEEIITENGSAITSSFEVDLRRKEWMSPKLFSALKDAYKAVSSASTIHGSQTHESFVDFCCNVGRHRTEPVFKNFKNSANAFTNLAKFAKDHKFGVHRSKGADAGNEPIQILTLHASKGKEFKVVFLTGLEEGVLPLWRQKEAEEARLCYVGATRAEQKLYLTHARSRPNRRGELSGSQFIKRMLP